MMNDTTSANIPVLYDFTENWANIPPYKAGIINVKTFFIESGMFDITPWPNAVANITKNTAT